MDTQEGTHIFDNPRNVKRVVHALWLLCAIAFALEFVVHRHADHPWEGLVLFYCWFGFGACFVLVELSKLLRRLVMRDEDFYEKDDA